MIKKLNSRVIFHNKELYKTYKNLESGNFEQKKLYKWISQAVEDLKENGFCGLAVPKNRIPKKYKKEFDAKTIWKYDLPSAYRLIYTIENDRIEIYSIILEWKSHKEYEKLFKY